MLLLQKCSLQSASPILSCWIVWDFIALTWLTGFQSVCNTGGGVVWSNCRDFYTVGAFYSNHFSVSSVEVAYFSTWSCIWTESYKALWKTVLGEKTDFMHSFTEHRLKPVAPASPSLTGLPLVVSGLTVLVAPTLCWWLPHSASGLAAGENGREMKILGAGYRKGCGLGREEAGLAEKVSAHTSRSS